MLYVRLLEASVTILPWRISGTADMYSQELVTKYTVWAPSTAAVTLSEVDMSPYGTLRMGYHERYKQIDGRAKLTSNSLSDQVSRS